MLHLDPSNPLSSESSESLIVIRGMRPRTRTSLNKNEGVTVQSCEWMQVNAISLFEYDPDFKFFKKILKRILNLFLKEKPNDRPSLQGISSDFNLSSLESDTLLFLKNGLYSRSYISVYIAGYRYCLCCAISDRKVQKRYRKTDLKIKNSINCSFSVIWSTGNHVLMTLYCHTQMGIIPPSTGFKLSFRI